MERGLRRRLSASTDLQPGSKQLLKRHNQNGDETRSLKLIAYELLRNKLQSLELPPGMVTSDSELARLLGMSRTPVREALNRLEHDCLVTRVPNHGVLVRDLSLDEIMHIHAMREALDGMAARLAVGRINREELVEIKSLFERLDIASGSSSLAQHAALSAKLHAAIVMSTGNPYLQSATESLTAAFERMRRHSWRIWGGEQDAGKLAARRYKEHFEIIAALQRADPDKAERAARRHVANALQDLLKVASRIK